MMRDERIQADMRLIGSRIFGLWYFLLLVSLLYRQFFLGQPLDQYWDIALIFFGGTLYASTALFARGAVYQNTIARSVKIGVPIMLVTIVAVAYFLGNIQSLGDLARTIVGATIGLALMSALFYFLYRRWERRIEAE
jgi:pilus assembly protein TadC